MILFLDIFVFICIGVIVIIAIVFLGLLIATITLGQTSIVEAHNQTREIYAFARDSRPIHYPMHHNQTI